MSYVDRVLQPGEAVRYRGTIHWIVYLPGLFFLAFAAGAAIMATQAADPLLFNGAGILVGVIAAFSLFRAWFGRWTTEIAVTDRRIIYKEGFISRRTVETHMDKVESVDVDQGILGRMLDFGDVIVHGTGASREPMRRVQSPIEFRNCITAR